jgi:hypothetical protein
MQMHVTEMEWGAYTLRRRANTREMKFIMYHNFWTQSSSALLHDNGKFIFKSRLYTGCLKKNAMEIQQAVVHHKRS